MKTVLIVATAIVNLALLSYSIAILTEQIRHRLSGRVMGFVSAGLAFDLTSTILMIIGSENPPYTLHGILGYSSLSGMLVDAFLLWRLRIRLGKGSTVPAALHLYTRVAYIWWILAYLTGVVIVILK
jgi:hypothetical protein